MIKQATHHHTYKSATGPYHELLWL